MSDETEKLRVGDKLRIPEIIVTVAEVTDDNKVILDKPFGENAKILLQVGADGIIDAFIRNHGAEIIRAKRKLKLHEWAEVARREERNFWVRNCKTGFEVFLCSTGYFEGEGKNVNLFDDYEEVTE